MKVLPIEGNKKSIAELAQMARNGPVILTCDGRPLGCAKKLVRKRLGVGFSGEQPTIHGYYREFATFFSPQRRNREQVRKELGLKNKNRQRRDAKEKRSNE